ncbi:MAG: alpha-E domain-containing protein [Bacteroidota bacterium]
MLSRVAYSIYWMNRYMERAENYARFISVNFNLSLDLPAEVPEQWEPLIIATADDELFLKHYDTPSRVNVVYFMTFDAHNPNSILSNLYYARENARSIRESISKEMWEHINQFYWKVKDLSTVKDLDMNALQEFFNEVKMGSQLFFGIVDSTITRGEGWNFGRVGRFLERADKTSRCVDMKNFQALPGEEAAGSPLDILQWSSVLKAASAYNMFRQQYNAITPVNIVEFLLLDRKFPRSVMYCIRQAELSLYEISGSPVGVLTNMAERKIGKLRSELEFIDVQEIFDFGLHEYIDSFQTKDNDIAAEVYNTFFALKPIENQ